MKDHISDLYLGLFLTPDKRAKYGYKEIDEERLYKKFSSKIKKYIWQKMRIADRSKKKEFDAYNNEVDEIYSYILVSLSIKNTGSDKHAQNSFFRMLIEKKLSGETKDELNKLIYYKCREVINRYKRATAPLYHRLKDVVGKRLDAFVKKGLLSCEKVKSRKFYFLNDKEISESRLLITDEAQQIEAIFKLLKNHQFDIRLAEMPSKTEVMNSDFIENNFDNSNDRMRSHFGGVEEAIKLVIENIKLGKIERYDAYSLTNLLIPVIEEHHNRIPGNKQIKFKKPIEVSFDSKSNDSDKDNGYENTCLDDVVGAVKKLSSVNVKNIYVDNKKNIDKWVKETVDLARLIKKADCKIKMSLYFLALNLDEEGFSLLFPENSPILSEIEVAENGNNTKFLAEKFGISPASTTYYKNEILQFISFRVNDLNDYLCCEGMESLPVKDAFRIIIRKLHEVYIESEV